MKEPTRAILTWWKNFQEWKHMVGSPSYGLSGQWDLLNKQYLRFLSCFFRLNYHLFCLKIAYSQMCLQISRIFKWQCNVAMCNVAIQVTLSAAEWFFNLVLIFIYLLISRICKSRGTLSSAKWFFFLGLISMYLQIRRICRLRVALWVAEWFYILVLIF